MATNQSNSSEDLGITRAINELITVNPDLQVNIDEMNIMLEFFVSDPVFGKMGGKSRGRMISGHNSMAKFLYELKLHRRVQQLKKLYL